MHRSPLLPVLLLPVLLLLALTTVASAADVALLGQSSGGGPAAVADDAAATAVRVLATVSHTEGVLVASAGRPVQSGEASFYGHRDGFHGRQTANGEIFDAYGKLTAAHKTMRFGTRLRVVNRANGKSVVVRINDRGPYYGGRIIDLSYLAAQQLGMVASGVAKVDLYVVR